MRRIVIVVSALALALASACGGKKPPKQPGDGDTSSSDTPKEATDDTKADGGGLTDDSKTPPPSDEPTVGACEVKAGGQLVSCAESKLGGDEMAKSKERCTKASGEARDGACGRDGVAATCDVPDKNLVVLTYAATKPAETKGRVKSAKGGCEALGGTFTPAAAPAKPKKGGKPKKK